ncbi:restriction endonuclease subunit S [bacterium]|nr:restriction endonuclease subunit S [bacterium]
MEKGSLRFDSEYYHPQNLLLSQTLKSKGHNQIDDFAFVTDGIHASIDFDENSKINLLSAKAPKENYFDLSGTGFISKVQDEKNKRTRLKENDIVVSTVGTIGNCAVVDKSILPANSDRHVGIIRIEKSYQPYFISSFLLSKYGRFQTLRESTGNVQLNLFIYKIKEITVPNLSQNFQKLIQDVCFEAHILKTYSVKLYSQAEQLLLSELGLLDWQPEHQLAFVKNYSDTQQADRFDAEYFQPKYEEIVEAVKKYRNGFDELGNLVKIKDRNFTPKDNEQYKYIELANISSNGEINGYTENFGNELPSRARRKVQKDDLIVSSIEGSLESIALITEDWKNALCSTGFFAVNSDKINSETLLVLLKTKVGQLQLKKVVKEQF